MALSGLIAAARRIVFCISEAARGSFWAFYQKR